MPGLIEKCLALGLYITDEQEGGMVCLTLWGLGHRRSSYYQVGHGDRRVALHFLLAAAEGFVGRKASIADVDAFASLVRR